MRPSRRDSPAAATPGIVVRGLTKRFGSVTALDSLDLTVAPGEIVALLGRNGAGKSTLLRILGTTVLPDHGSATIAGFDVVRQAPQARRSLGVVLGDERSWYWRLSGRANLEFFGAMYGLSSSAARQRADEVLRELRLDSVADRRFYGYSSGMRARLSIARSILADPAVLLLDEPSRTLDPVVAAEFRRLVVERATKDSLAVLWVTHDLQEASEVADRVMLIVTGRITAEQIRPESSAELNQMFAHATAEPEEAVE